MSASFFILEGESGLLPCCRWCKVGLPASPLAAPSEDILILGGTRARLRALCLGRCDSVAICPSGTEKALTSVTALNCTVVLVGEVCDELFVLPLKVTGISTSIEDI